MLLNKPRLQRKLWRAFEGLQRL